MNKRIMYWRRKGKKIIAEGRMDSKGKKKTVYLFTLPDIEILLEKSLFPSEKTAKIMEKIRRLKVKEDVTLTTKNKNFAQ